MEITTRDTGKIKEVSQLVWGLNIRPELFSRWSQGFILSSDETTGLLQTAGGPCAVIAPVQAFLLKFIIAAHSLSQQRQLDSEAIDHHLASALTEILCQCRISPTNSTEKPSQSPPQTDSNQKIQEEGPFELACLDDPLPENNANHTTEESSSQEPDEPKPGPTAKDHHLFHSHIRIREFDSAHALQTHLERNLNKYKCQYGVLLFLYSVILTKGVTVVQEEMGDLGESMIDNNEGHGSQALINLIISGRASPYVWDGEKDVGGMSLVGIARRPAVGFLTRLEHLRYVQVGWYLKNPTNAVWVLGSETHLTVLFSWSKNLVTPDCEVERAKQVFSWYDTEGNNFIPRDKLKEVLEKLNLCTDDDFIQFMCKELDPESMGVILYHKFVEAFFTPDESYKPPDTFTVFHYNGLESSCPQNKIQFAEICVTLQESHVRFSPSNNSEFLSCLTTKWPNLDVIFNDFVPSLN